ncbi:MAG: tRNA lysidine(34) synthetase TilS [Pelolinea sp.]|nr:tRNA lysidine(34) synthetase TilS [Pelolinea sp.]
MPDDQIVLGFSGGADSVCLLEILSRIGFQVRIAYFNHQLRAAVEKEIQFVKNTANRYALDFTIGTENILSLAKNKGRGIEETARFYRYQFLFDIAKESNAKAVIVAHHADDQVETILMNLIRGTGLNGLIGMDMVSFSEFSTSIPIIRPILNSWKIEILDFCKENRLSFMIDETNEDEEFTRNSLRGSLIPMLEKYNPNIKQGLFRMGMILRDEYDFLTKCADNAVDNVVQRSRQGFVEMDALEFGKYAVSVQRNVIDRLLDTYFNLENTKSFNLIENIRKVLIGEVNSNYSKLLDGLQVVLEKNSGYLCVDIHDLEEEDELFLQNENTRVVNQGVTAINDTWRITSEVLPIDQVKNIFGKNENMYIAYLDANSLRDHLELRKWKEGIRYAPLGLSGHSMKLSDFWINKGFPKRKRANWPLVISSEEIIWIPGFQPAYSVRITRRTKNVLKLSVDRI